MKELDCFQLEVIHPKSTKTLYVEWINAETPSGNFVVGANHCDLVSILKDGSKLKYKEFKKKEIQEMNMLGGFLSVKEGNAVLIVDF